MVHEGVLFAVVCIIQLFTIRLFIVKLVVRAVHVIGLLSLRYFSGYRYSRDHPSMAIHYDYDMTIQITLGSSSSFPEFWGCTH